MALSIIDIENIRFTELHQAFLAHHEPFSERWRKLHLSIDPTNWDARQIPNVAGAVVGDIQLQRSIPVNVGQCKCGAAKSRLGTGGLSGIVEFARTVIQKAQN